VGKKNRGTGYTVGGNFSIPDLVDPDGNHLGPVHGRQKIELAAEINYFLKRFRVEKIPVQHFHPHDNAVGGTELGMLFNELYKRMVLGKQIRKKGFYGNLKGIVKKKAG
jgi:hypothetical protein